MLVKSVLAISAGMNILFIIFCVFFHQIKLNYFIDVVVVTKAHPLVVRMSMNVRKIHAIQVLNA